VLDAREAAEFLGAHVESVRRLARKGALPGYKIGKDWRFRREALTRWSETHHQRHRPPSILLVDDEPGIRDAYGPILQEEGYQVSTAASGVEALKWMEAAPFDLVILDLRMPLMDGPTTLGEIRKRHGPVAVIVLTGYPDSDLMARALRYSPVMMLSKPAKPHQVVGCVRLMLNGAHGGDTPPRSSGGV
jgi:excisionase family DNA binding protein